MKIQLAKIMPSLEMKRAGPIRLERKNTYIGYKAGGPATLINASAIGANATVNANNSVVVGVQGQRRHWDICTFIPTSPQHRCGCQSQFTELDNASD